LALIQLLTLKLTIMNFQTMSKQRKFVLISAAVGIISMFLPWVSISLFGYTGGSVNGMHGKGVLVFFCFLISGGLAYLGDQSKNLDKTSWSVTLLAAAVALVFIIWFYSEATNSIMGSSFIGYGIYVAAIAAIGVLGSAYLFKSAADNLKDGFNTLKQEIESKLANSSKAASSPATNGGQEAASPSAPPPAADITLEENPNPPF
jgi:hypothetical protein